MSEDPHLLQRFLDAQEAVYPAVRSELSAGSKRSHWMWFIFPQVAGLGSSWMAQKYSIHSRKEAEAYLAHPVLGERLRECTRLVISHQGRSLQHILGYPDDLKFRSSMTLFAAVSEPGSVFDQALASHCGGQRDPLTLERLH